MLSPARALSVAMLAVFLAGCGTAGPSEGQATPSSEAATSEPRPPATTDTTEPSTTTSDRPTTTGTTQPLTTSTSEPSEPPQLFGTWRATLGGQPLTLTLTETTYRIVRGGNTGAGSVRVSGDEIEFFNSGLCSGIGLYRWEISDGSLSFSASSEECPGRLEALLVRYPEYSPPSEG